MTLINLAGKRFENWRVIERVPGSPATWLCRCACGREMNVIGANLKSGRSRSCGCKALELKNASEEMVLDEPECPDNWLLNDERMPWPEEYFGLKPRAQSSMCGLLEQGEA